MIITGTAPINIANGQSLSSIVRLSFSQALVGILMPAAWDAANLTLQASLDADAPVPVWTNVYKPDGTEYTILAAAGRFIAIPITDLLGFTAFKFRSGTAGTPVAQTAARVLTALSRES